MKNIDYLEQFFRKHKLSGKVKVKYDSPIAVDDYMSDIIFENGDIINISDIIFDIDSDFPEDIAEQWMEAKKKNNISFIDWIQENPNYFPKDMDTSSVRSYQIELENIVNDMKTQITKMFELEEDDGDSDEDEKGEDY